MTDIHINPGAGPVEPGTAQKALFNVRKLCAEAEIDLRQITGMAPKCLENGRWRFLVWRNLNDHVTVDMPGLPLGDVRPKAGDNLLEFPRIYINGSSWSWNFAVNVLGDLFFNGEEDEEEDEPMVTVTPAHPSFEEWLSGKLSALPQGEPWNDRGFDAFEPIKTDYGHTVQVTESSVADGSYLWIRTNREKKVGEMYGFKENAEESTAVHLKTEDALQHALTIISAVWNHYQGRPS